MSTMPNLPWLHRTTAQLAILGTCHGSRIVTTHHFEVNPLTEGTFTTDAAAAAGLATLVANWVANEKPEYLACLPADYTMVMVRGQVLERPGLWRHRLTPTETATGGTGTAGGGVATEDVDSCGVIRWRTPQAGKSFRGRSYMGPIVDSWKTNGLLSSAAITAITAYSTAMTATYTGAGVASSLWALTIYSRPYNTGDYSYPQGANPTRTFFYPPDYAGNSTNVVSGSVDPILRTQRRRQIGVGA